MEKIVILIKGDFSSRNGVSMPVGTIIRAPIDKPIPNGWVACDGQTVEELAEYPALQNWMIREGIIFLPSEDESFPVDRVVQKPIE